MKQYFLLFLLVYTLSSCKKEGNNTVAAQKEQAEDSLVTRVKQDGDVYSIEIDNYDKKNKRPYLPTPLASKYADTLYNRLDADEKSEIKTVRVKVNSVVKSDLYDFKPEDMKRVGPFKALAEKAILKLAAKDYDGFYALMNPQYVTHQVFMDGFISRTVAPFPDAFEGIKKVHTAGYEFTTTEGIAVVTIYSKTTSAKGEEREYEITITDTPEPKIAGIWLDKAK